MRFNEPHHKVLLKKSKLLEDLLIDTINDDGKFSEFLNNYSINVVNCPLDAITMTELYINNMEAELRIYGVTYQDLLPEFYKNE